MNIKTALNKQGIYDPALERALIDAINAQQLEIPAHSIPLNPEENRRSRMDCAIESWPFALKGGSIVAKMGAPYGERHGKVTHSDAVVREIRERYYDKGEKVLALSKEFGISEFTLWDWVRFNTRVHS